MLWSRLVCHVYGGTDPPTTINCRYARLLLVGGNPAVLSTHHDVAPRTGSAKPEFLRLESSQLLGGQSKRVPYFLFFMMIEATCTHTRRHLVLYSLSVCPDEALTSLASYCTIVCTQEYGLA